MSSSVRSPSPRTPRSPPPRASAGSSPARRRCSPRQSTRWPTSPTRSCSRSAKCAAGAVPTRRIPSAAARRNSSGRWSPRSACFSSAAASTSTTACTRCCSNAPVEPFTPLVLGLLLFALALESFTFVVALREIGGWKGLAENRTNTTVLAVVLEDAVALLGILLTLLVAGVSLCAWPATCLRRGRGDHGGRAARRDGAVSRGDQSPLAHRCLRSCARPAGRGVPGGQRRARRCALDRGR